MFVTFKQNLCLIWKGVTTFVATTNKHLTAMAKDEIIRIRIRGKMKAQLKKVVAKKGLTISEYLLDFIKETIK